MLNLWLANWPILIGALVTLINAPYAINKGSISASNIIANAKTFFEKSSKLEDKNKTT